MQALLCRKLPIFTFVNKMDRPALEPLDIMDQLEAEFGLKSYPVNWPIGSGDRCILHPVQLNGIMSQPLLLLCKEGCPPSYFAGLCSKIYRRGRQLH